MLTLLKPDGSGLNIKCDDYHVRELANGLDELEFEVSIWDEAYPLLVEEARIKEASPSTTQNWYRVKAVDAGSETATIKCQIDLNDWKRSILRKHNLFLGTPPYSFFDAVEAVRSQAWVNQWSIVNETTRYCYASDLEFDGATPLQELQALIEDYFPGCGYRFDTINHKLTLKSQPNAITQVPYITREVNLREINYKGKSTEFATRLYPYGENDLSISSVNGGVAYIDDHSYSDEVIAAFWQDTAYTDATALLNAARAMLAEMASPVRSYEVDIVDLAATNPEEYGFLSFPLFQVANLIDEARGLRTRLMVVERHVYPYFPQNNKIIFSTSAQRIQNQVTRALARKIKV